MPACAVAWKDTTIRDESTRGRARRRALSTANAACDDDSWIARLLRGSCVCWARCYQVSPTACTINSLANPHAHRKNFRYNPEKRDRCVRPRRNCSSWAAHSSLVHDCNALPYASALALHIGNARRQLAPPRRDKRMSSEG